MTDTDPELPRALALAWGVAAAPQRGPKRELSIERIVEVAAELADEGGLAAVSMSAIAQRLGFTTMALYRYVSAKEDLILLLHEHGIGLPPIGIQDAGHWKDAIRTWTREVVAVYSAHSWLLDIPIVGIPHTPNNLAWLDALLQVLERTGLEPRDRMSAALLVTGWSRWQGIVNRSYDIAIRDAGVTPEEFEQGDASLLSALVSADAFPALRDVIDSGAFSDGTDPFPWGLERILDGIERAIDGTPTPPPEGHVAPDAYPKDAAVREARAKRRELEGKLREAVRKEKDVIAKARAREAKGK